MKLIDSIKWILARLKRVREKEDEKKPLGDGGWFNKKDDSRDKVQIFLVDERFNGGTWFNEDELLSLKYTIDTALQNIRKYPKKDKGEEK